MKTSFRTMSALALAVATASGSAYSAQLEEVIVTAQKRAESLQDVPISMTAISGDKIQDAGIQSMTELSSYVPNLGISENAVNSIISMRGISIGSNQAFEQSVGIFVDGVHYGKSREIRTGLFDLGQVEVLRGPQGILFGKNTLAGAINVTSASAVIGDEMNGRVSVAAESNEGKTAEAVINMPVSDNMAVRLAYRDRSDDGYMSNGFSTTGNGATATMPTTDEEVWRLSATWEPNDSTVVKLKHTESDFVRRGSTAALVRFQPEENIAASNGLMYGVMGQVYPTYGASVLAAGTSNTDGFRDSISIGGLALAQSLGTSLDQTSEKPEGTDTQTAATSLSVEWELGNGYTVTSVTGMTGYEYEDGIDADFLPVSFIGRSDISEYDQFSQEIRIASPTDTSFSWIAGGQMQSAEQQIDRTVIFDGTVGAPGLLAALTGCRTFLAVPGGGCVNGVTAFDKSGRVSTWQTDTDSFALFFQGTYDISDSLSLTAGLRYTEEEKDVYTRVDIVQDAALVDGVMVNDIRNLATPDLNPYNAALNAATFDSYQHEFDEDRKTDQLMPALSLEWEMSDTSMFYISYAEGFKSGGFNAVDSQMPAFDAATGAPLSTTPGLGFEYDDETAQSVEIGGKHTLMDGAMTVNWAMFTSEYVDQQVSTFVGLGFVVANAASSDVQGVEVDMQWQATDNLRLGANLAILDAEYADFTAAGCTAQQDSALLGLGTLTSASPVTSAMGCSAQFNAAGAKSGQSQDLSGSDFGAGYSGSLTADYAQPLSNGLVMFAAADYNFTDEFKMTGDHDPLDVQESYGKVNLRFGIRAENWDFLIYGKNVTDKQTAQGAFDIPLASGSHGRYQDPGEVWGGRFTYRF
jgi:outer membrane receptor protein involved in Fe transport